MPLGPFDEYLAHQTSDTFDHVATSDRHFYDRYYFNMHSSSDELFVITGLGQYPNLGVTDAFITVSVGTEQHTVRASRELGVDRMDTSVGPLSVEVLEGLRTLRIRCDDNEWGISADLTFTGTVDALEEPRTFIRRYGRVIQDVTRYAQVGVWEGTLTAGDLLYIPRGWWHVALPLDEPTLHLTVGLHQQNGVDLLNWFGERLRSERAVRQDLPRFATADEKAAYLCSIREAFLTNWTAGILDEYFAESDVRIQTRPHFSLPWTATVRGLPDDAGNWSVKWNVPRPLNLTPDKESGVLKIATKGKQWTFAAAAAPLLCALQDQGTCTVEELLDSGHLSAEVVRSFVKELVEAGLATVVCYGNHAV